MGSFIFFVSRFVPVIVSIFIIRHVHGFSNNYTDVGIIICSGDGDMFNELLGLLYQFDSHREDTTSIWQASYLPFTIAHCNELPPDKQSILKKFFPGINILDICSINRLSVHQNRLKGFFCKPMALIHSPYNHTIVMDTDVIWLQDPITMLNFHDYQRTGTLYFRDRWTLSKNKLTLTAGRHRAYELHSYMMKVSEELVKMHGSEYHNHKLRNGTLLMQENAFWRNFATGEGQTLDHMQDSSVVVMNAQMIPRTIQALRYMLKDFNKGYGDKEIYWIASTIANEAYMFEPHVAGSLGDCGALLHFHPISSQPMYINAEYLIDMGKIKAAGDFLTVNGVEVQVSLPMRMDEQASKISVLVEWKNMIHGFYPCGACKLFTCKPADNTIVSEIRTRQKVLLEMKASGTSMPYLERLFVVNAVA